jgi:hypothetical protein
MKKLNESEHDTIEKVLVLIEQGNYREANSLINAMLAENENNARLHALRLRLFALYETDDMYSRTNVSLNKLKELEHPEDEYSEWLAQIMEHYSPRLLKALCKVDPLAKDVKGLQLERFLPLQWHSWQGEIVYAFQELFAWYLDNEIKKPQQGGGGLFGSLRTNNRTPHEVLEKRLETVKSKPDNPLTPVFFVCLADVYACRANVSGAIRAYKDSLAHMTDDHKPLRWLWKRAFQQILTQVYYHTQARNETSEALPESALLALQSLELPSLALGLAQAYSMLHAERYEEALAAFLRVSSVETTLVVPEASELDTLERVAEAFKADAPPFEKPLTTDANVMRDEAEVGRLNALTRLHRWEETLTLLDAQLDRDPPNAFMSDLYSLKERVQEGYRHALHKHNVQIAHEAYARQDWQVACAHYALCVDAENTTTHDRLRYAVALVFSGGELGRVNLLLRQMNPTELEGLEPRDRQAFLEAIYRAELWAGAHRHVENLPLSEEEAQTYHDRYTAYVARQVAVGRDALRQNDVTTAKAVSQRLRQMNVTDTEALLFVAQWLEYDRQWHTLRTFLERFAALDERILPYLIKADVEEGYLQEARERLKAVVSPTLARELSQMIDARAAFRPYFHVTQFSGSVMPDSLRYHANKPMWNSAFAVELKEVGYTLHPMNALRMMFDRDMADFLTALHNNPSNTAYHHFSWRIIARAGQLKVVLLCCVEAFSEAQALAESHDVWDMLTRLLPLQQGNIFYYEPIYDIETLKALYDPFPIEAAYQVIRKERTNVGNSLHISTLSLADTDRHAVLEALLKAEQDILLDVYFHATELMAWERNNSPFLTANPDIPRTSTLDDGSLQLLERMVRDAHSQHVDNHFGSYPYVVQIRLASTRHVSLGLRSVIRVGLFGQSPVDFMSAETAEERQIAIRNLHTLRAERWGYELQALHGNRWRYLYSPLEVVAATRLPLPKADGIPGMASVQVRQATPPKSLSEQGVVIGELLTPINGRRKLVRLSIEDRMRHVYVVGRTGTGKSSLLQHMILQDIEQGYGVIVIDPHGDLVEGVLERCPTYREQDVMLFDPSDTEYPIGFNLLDVEGDFQRNIVISDFIGLLYAIFDPTRVGMIGPRFENAVRQSMLVTMDLHNGSFLEMVRMMTDKKFRDQAVEFVQDPMVRMYWKEIASDFARLGDGNMMDYVTSKFARFQVSPLRNIIGQGRTVLDIERMMSEQRILLVNLSKGKIGPETSQFLGLVLIPQIFIATLKRAKLPQSERHPICLYVDEFHNLTTSSFSQMLAEARKYGLAITVANQFISQLTDSVREAIFGNVGTLLSFRVGVKDAMFLAEEYHPSYMADDLINLPNYHLLVKSLVEGERIERFPIRTLADEYVTDFTRADRIRNQSRLSHARDRRIVEYEILQRLKEPPKRKEAPKRH